MKAQFSILVVAFGLFGCGDDKDDTNPVNSGASSIEVPSAYVFDSRFSSGQSSVSYSGQVVRNLLLQDLKIFTGNLGKDGAQSASAQDMLNYYAHDDAFSLETLTDPKDYSALESRYSSMSTGKNLSGKISSDIVIGYDKTADALVREWIDIIADNSQDAAKLGTPAVYTTEEGVDLSQMINKVLIGAVPYYQATGKYLHQLFEKGNAEAKEGKTYTDMEHYWDEAFGYFGAAADYNRYSDADVKAGVNLDSNGDGKINFKSEYNFAIAKGAAKRDIGGTGVNFTSDIFTAFLTGRTLIVNQGSEADIAAQREVAANGMEKVIAATVVHYINDTLGDLKAYGTSDYNETNHNKHWAEMKGYAVGLQFNPFRLISEGQLRELHDKLGQAPIYAEAGSAAYNDATEDYIDARTILQNAYGFSSANTENW